MSNKGARTRGVRWNADTDSFELWCPECERHGGGATFWPLTLEFWEPGRMQRCRACERGRKARAIAERRFRDPEWYLRTLADVREQKRFKNSLYNRRYRERRKAREAAQAA